MRSDDIELSLEIAKGVAPFELVEREHLLKPDDWAWQFLRLSPEYRAAYAEASCKQREDPTSRVMAGPWPHEQVAERQVFVDERICHKRFGLSTWLSPEHLRLPQLKKDQSWYWPLKAVVHWSEFITGAEVSDGTFGPSTPRPKPKPPKQHPQTPTGIRVADRKPAAVWFAVDCSVPPDAQIRSIRHKAKDYADQLRKAGYTSRHLHHCQHTVKALVGDKNFNSGDLSLPAAAADGVDDPAELWRLVCVDVLGAANEQVDECRELLGAEHRWLVQSGLAKPPENERLRLNLGSTRSTPDSLTDGHALKAYVLIEQCRLAGKTSPADIVAYVERKAYEGTPTSRPSEALDDWLAGRVGRVAGYLEKAHLYVSGGYKWLIHAERP